MTNTYDSTADTLQHIKTVNKYLLGASGALLIRAIKHDDSKLASPEKELFDELTPILKNLTYGSDEYKDSLAKLKPALDHHYANNSHHPEHYQNGIDGMTLLDVIEMFYDWKAASERTAKGDIRLSVKINAERFNMSQQLVNIFNNTINSHKW